MKLPSGEACLLAFPWGNQKEKTVMGETRMEGLSDRGSIPLSSIDSTDCLIFILWLCNVFIKIP